MNKDEIIIQGIEWLKEREYDELYSDYTDKIILKLFEKAISDLYSQLSYEALKKYVPGFEYKEDNINEPIQKFIYNPNNDNNQENVRRKCK